MQRPVFCRDCPDLRGSECALPSTPVLIADKLAMPTVKAANAIIHIFEAAGGVPDLVVDPTGLVEAVNGTRSEREAKVEACIFAHIEAAVYK